MNPTVEALRQEFGAKIGRALVSCNQTIVYIEPEAVIPVMTWLRDQPGQDYDYLVDLTAVEYRDHERPLEVVYQLRSLDSLAELRVKVELPQDGGSPAPNQKKKGAPSGRASRKSSKLPA